MGSWPGGHEPEKLINVFFVQLFPWFTVFVLSGQFHLGFFDQGLEFVLFNRYLHLLEDHEAEIEEIFVGYVAIIFSVELGPDRIDHLLQHGSLRFCFLRLKFRRSPLALFAQLRVHSWSLLVLAFSEIFFIIWIPALLSLDHCVCVDNGVPEAGEPSTCEGSSDVDDRAHLAQQGFGPLSVGILPFVHCVLEHCLEQPYGWVDASSGYATGHAYG